MADKLSFDRILIVTDATDTGVHAARYAVRFAALHKARLTAIAIVDTEILKALLTSSVLVEAEMQEFAQDFETSARTGLKYVAQLAERAGVHADMLLRKGAPHSVVIDETRRHEPDLLIMGTFSTSMIRRELNARERRLIVDEVKCPILLVP